MKKFAKELTSYFTEAPWLLIGQNFDEKTIEPLDNLIYPQGYIKVYKNTAEYGLYSIVFGDGVSSLIIDSEFVSPLAIRFDERMYITHKKGNGCMVVSEREIKPNWTLKFIYGDKVYLNDKVIHDETL